MTALKGLGFHAQRLIGQRPRLFSFAGINVFAGPVKMPIFGRPARDAVGAAVFPKTIAAGALGNNAAVCFVG